MSEIKVDTVAEKTSANGVTIDGLNIKDSKLVTANSVVPTNLGYNYNQYRNIIINGDMSIAQRGTSFTGLGDTDSKYTLDRFKWSEEGSSGTAEFTITQSTDVPTGQGFATSLKLDCTTADTSIDSGNIIYIEQRVEGQNLQYLKYGTSSAESTTLSFWVKSNKTGTYTVNALGDIGGSGKLYSQAYTISSADTWEKKTLTFIGDTALAINNNSSNGLQLMWNLLAGTSKSSGSLQTWGSNTQANRAVGQVNLADSTSNELYITGIQLEAGTTASDFEFLPVDVQTQRCLRYYETSMSYGVYGQYHGQQVVFGSGGATFSASTSAAGGRQYKVWKRANPTVTLYHQDGTSGALYTIYNAAKITGVTAQHLNQSGFLFASKSGAFGQGIGYYYSFTADAEL